MSEKPGAVHVVLLSIDHSATASETWVPLVTPWHLSTRAFSAPGVAYEHLRDCPGALRRLAHLAVLAATSRIQELFEGGVLGSPFLCFANLAEAHRDSKVDLRGFGFEVFLDYMTRPAVEVYGDFDTANPLSAASYRDACRRFVATYRRIAIGRANRLRLGRAAFMVNVAGTVLSWLREARSCRRKFGLRPG